MSGKRSARSCQICGDSASSCNFKVMTCDSCKAFFRRNALRRQDIAACQFGGKCVVNQVTRKFCPSCRLDKCFLEGMCKGLIQCDGETNVKRRKVTNSTNSKDANAVVTVVEGTELICDSLVKQEVDQARIVASRQIPDFSAAPADNLDAIIAVVIEAEFHAGEHIKQAEHQRLQLNETERGRLNELFVASQSLDEPLDLETRHLDGETNVSMQSVLSLTELAVKRIIRMAMRIKSFSSLCLEDQMALMTGGCSELMVLRSVYNYNSANDSWQLPSVGADGPRQLKLELLKETRGLCDQVQFVSPMMVPNLCSTLFSLWQEALASCRSFNKFNSFQIDLYEEHHRFIHSFDVRWRSDEAAMLLMLAISLFTPTRKNVVHADAIKLEQDTYYFLLKRHIEVANIRTSQDETTGCDSRRIFLHMIDRLRDLHRINESHIKILLHLNLCQVAPLLMEIFDLKRNNCSNSSPEPPEQ